MAKNKFFGSTMVYLENVPYRVEDYPFEDVEKRGYDVLKKGVAYRYIRDIIVGDTTLKMSGLYPFHGYTKSDFSYTTSKVGIWLKKIKHDEIKEIIIRPRTPKEREEYKIGRERDLVAATLNNDFNVEQFADEMVQADIGTDVYMPPIHSDDDPLNMLLKLAIRLKGAPFDPYATRLKALAVDKNKGVEGANIVNNTKRGLRLNRALSPTKFMQFSDTWQVEPAIILRDLPNAMHKMHIPSGKMLVIYPNGIPFDIDPDDLIDVSDMIAKACSETLSDETHPKKDKQKESDDEEDD